MPALLEYVVDEALPDREEVLVRLASYDRDVVLRVLTLLCPCRSLSSPDEAAVRDALDAVCPRDGRHAPKKLWRAILDAQGAPDPMIRTKALAASVVLRAHARDCEGSHE